jgi:predicted O-methyltransferase YrrM
MRTEAAKAGLKNFVDDLKLKNAIMVEVGSFKGDSTIIFAKSGKFREIYCVDPFKNNIGDITDIVNMSKVEKHFKKTVSKYNFIYHIKELSTIAADQFDDESLDLVYVDALHTYEALKADLKAWLPKVKKGGFISGHDYRSRFKGVIKAVNEVIGTPDQVYKDTSWLIRLV